MRIVRNPLTGVPVVIAPGRASRPGAAGRTTRTTEAKTCPLCEGNEAMTPPETLAIGRPESAPPDSPGWSVRVVPNKYPAFDGQEVIVHGPAHTTRFADVPADVVADTGRAWELRTQAAVDAGAAWVLLCVNEGPGAGASLDHSHSQLVPFAEIPPLLELEVAASADGCRLCEAMAGERENVVASADSIDTFCPSWSRMPFETWIAPAAHAARPADYAVVTRAIQTAVARLGAVLGTELSWNAIVHASPPRGPDFHWHVEILPRLTVPASVEFGAGVWVNTVDPAVAAAELRG
jgi:UDPglucose--hexose-1-phosphate uridylyltransferase